MLDVAAAREIVLRHTKPQPAVEVGFGSDVLGQLLARDVPADIDSPPFDKSMMDGYAVRSSDCASPGTVLKVIGEVAAGAVSTNPVGVGETVRIFTGAPIPPGADGVVKQEESTVEGEGVRLHKAVKAGVNIFRRGSEMTAGQVVLPAGMVLSPFAFGLWAAVGGPPLAVVPRPRVAVIATGNELVRPNQMPVAGQIRDTNSFMLIALANRAGGVIRSFGSASDDASQMTDRIRDGLRAADILLLSGGVSVGKYDLVPDVLKSLGVEIHFHTVRMKPGKPLLFGTLGDKLVFGLPGNPVSAAVGFELFVRPAIDIMCGRTDPGPKVRRLPLSEPLTAKHDRPTYHPAVIGADSVRPLPWQGSADLRALLPANGYIVLPPGEVSFAAGDVVKVIDTR